MRDYTYWRNKKRNGQTIPAHSPVTFDTVDPLDSVDTIDSTRFCSTIESKESTDSIESTLVKP
ncbi:hypothetical protein GCM10028810_24120 [Spirosoma litoris]